MRRGTWVPLLPKAARLAVITIVPVIPIGWGLDYVLPGDEDVASLSVVEQAMPLTVWGVLCLASGVAALVGFIGQWRRLAVVGLWIGGSTFAALAAGQWAAVWGEPWLDGVRGPILATIVAFAQMGMAAGYALQPDDDDVRREVEGE